MASFVTANGYDPLVYDYLIQRKAVQLNAIIASGVALVSSFLQDALAGGGSHYELSGYNALTYEEPNLSDESGTVVTPSSIADAVEKGRVAYLNEAWAVKTFAKDIVGQNPIIPITNSIAGYWANAMQKRMVASLLGIMADNIANDSGDMVLDVSTDGSGAVAAGERFSAANLITAKQTAGDHSKFFTHIIVNSIIKSRMETLNLVSTIPNARGEIMFETYLGLKLIIDDESALVDTTGTNRDKYICILAGQGIIGLAEGRCSVPFATKRDEGTGNGGGEEFIHSRMSPAIHPWGFSWLDDTVVGKSASVAELALADNWDRIENRKNIPLAFLIVNDELV